jgi:SWI/SNF-related matrix-associated actin-dependent regulator of chromatin subfamily A member 5
LLPDFFAKSEDFDAMFEAATQKNAVLTQLHKILRPVMLRRLKSEVEKALLPKKETLVYVGMSAMQAKLYKEILQNDIEAINGTSTGPRLLNIVMQLRKAANHPYLFDGQEDRKLDEYGDHVITNSGTFVFTTIPYFLSEISHKVYI